MKIEQWNNARAAREARERFTTIGRARISLRSSNYTDDMYLTVSTDCLAADGRIISRASYDGFESGEATFEKACARAEVLDFADFADEWAYVAAIFGG